MTPCRTTLARPGTWAFRAIVCALLIGVLGACTETTLVAHTAKRVSRGNEAAVDSDLGSGIYKVGTPYQIKEVWYYPAVDYAYHETGIASWYGPGFHGKQTANGDTYDMNALTAAHRTLPMPSLVRVVNLENGRGIVLRVNDRGPFAHGRIIDVSRRAAQLLGFERKGTARVRVTILDAESRDIAARMSGGRQLAANESPLTVDRVPKPDVDSTSLPPPPGAAAAAPPPAAPGGQQVASARPLPPPAPGAEVGQLSQTVPQPGDIYIQAGAFAQYENANRVLARISGIGPARISSVLVNGRDLFRVRVGPMTDVAEADLLLEQVIGSGYPNARVIVD